MDAVEASARLEPRDEDLELNPSVASASAHARSVDTRIAFVLHASELVNHYRPIWERLDPAEFAILGSGGEAETGRIRGFAEPLGYSAYPIEDAVADGLYFRVVVTNHPGAGGAHSIEEIGALQVRMMYALGKDGWNFRSWNEQYDAILCWGPYQADKLSAFDRPRIVQIGYPRFDRFFRLTEPRRDVVARLGGDPDRPTLVWLPTWSRLSSIDAFAETIGELRNEMNVLLKVHPFTATQEPKRMELLASCGLTPIRELNLDNVELHYAADIVAADYGSSAFGAIYADRDLVLLNTPGLEPERDDEVSPDSLDRRLREWVLNVDPGEADAIRAYLADAEARAQQRMVRANLRRGLFAPFHGCASEVAVVALRNIEAIVR